MKIAVIAPTYLPAKRANTFQVMKMSQALVNAGHELCLLVPGHPPAQDAWPLLSEHYGLSTRFPVEWMPVSASLHSYDFGWRAVRWLKRKGADLLYTRHPQTAALASWMNIPAVLEIHDFPGGRLGPVLFRLFLAGRGARRVIAITRALADDLVSHLDSKKLPSLLQVSPDGVDLDRYSDLPDPPAARQYLLAQGLVPNLHINRLTAGYTGHLYPGRGEDLILELASRFSQLNWLVVGGEAKTVERLRAKAGRLQLENFFQTGFVSNTSLPVYQAACDFLLIPYSTKVAASSGGDISRYTSPMKVFEYLASGRTILASDLPVLREVLNPSNAVLLPPDNPEAWSAALHALANDPGRRAELSLNARTDAEKYSWKTRAARILEGL